MINFNDHTTVTSAIAGSVGVFTAMVKYDIAPHIHDSVNKMLEELGEAQLIMMKSFKEELHND